MLKPERRSYKIIVRDGPPKGYDTELRTLPIVTYPHPALRRPNAEVKTFDAKLKQLVDNLFKTMYEEDYGIGLAAPQVGVNLRLMVYNQLRKGSIHNREGDEVFVNPHIVAQSDTMKTGIEACLSFPNMDGPVPRSEWIEIEAVDLEGQPFKRRMEGEEARLFLHEYDHLDGVVYPDRVEEPHRQRLESRLTNMVKLYEAAGGKSPAL